jgi:hypothetical protein
LIGPDYSAEASEHDYPTDRQICSTSTSHANPAPHYAHRIMKDFSSDFSIEVLSQRWLEPEPEMDGCSHGQLRIVIGGITVLDGTDDDTSINKTALALSRTLKRDHLPDAPVAPHLVFHGCGFATMLESGCDLGANWSVRHQSGQVRLGDVIRFDGPSGDPRVEFPDLFCVVPVTHYRAQVIALARAALDFADHAEKRIVDPFDLAQWMAWQNELRETLATLSTH